jgi:hypothetical protein
VKQRSLRVLAIGCTPGDKLAQILNGSQTESISRLNLIRVTVDFHENIAASSSQLICKRQWQRIIEIIEPSRS